ncbi:MAG: hypothetical protein CBARDCOR_3975 [uncultured Caballeronia sp.]|nr:MAG: hypothetical protein CBARDCOR_3975 [uncultured Caballeronia sp.]
MAISVGEEISLTITAMGLRVNKGAGDRSGRTNYMKQRDLQALNAAAHSALDTKQDGESLDWNNEGAGNPVAINGTITPSDTKKDGDRTCRKLTMVAHAKGQTQTWAPTVCKTDGGKWALLKQ